MQTLLLLRGLLHAEVYPFLAGRGTFLACRIIVFAALVGTLLACANACLV